MELVGLSEEMGLVQPLTILISLLHNREKENK